MCYIDKKKKRLIATKDIVVWKLLKEGLRSQFFHNFQYKSGVTYKTRMLQLKFNNPTCFNNKTFHWLGSNYPNWSYRRHKDLMYIGEGFHSIYTKSYAKQCLKELTSIETDLIIKKFIIPKGAKYYKSRFGLLVSNQIRMK